MLSSPPYPTFTRTIARRGPRPVAHVTPHAWALEAFQALGAEDAGVADIAGFLPVLVGYKVVLGLLATSRLCKVLVR